ncbi:MAG TPA: hypothetical protein EYQ20_01070 [candidate division Zixibacteria bacterium]|nr:hypothetical protein [candidate division Zixibacteria bacterium]
MLNIVLIGCGGMGMAYRQALHLLKDRARVVAVIDPDLDRARKVAETLGCDRIACDYMDGRRRLIQRIDQIRQRRPGVSLRHLGRTGHPIEIFVRRPLCRWDAGRSDQPGPLDSAPGCGRGRPRGENNFYLRQNRVDMYTMN